VGELLESYELPLTECRTGETGEIVSLDIDTGLITRLRELGLVPGAFVRIARGGSPLIVEVGHARLCLRGEETAGVMLRIPLCPEGYPALLGAGLAFGQTDLA
jgi:Fe2+ transport system protein FeoA